MALILLNPSATDLLTAVLQKQIFVGQKGGLPKICYRHYPGWPWQLGQYRLVKMNLYKASNTIYVKEIHENGRNENWSFISTYETQKYLQNCSLRIIPCTSNISFHLHVYIYIYIYIIDLLFNQGFGDMWFNLSPKTCMKGIVTWGYA